VPGAFDEASHWRGMQSLIMDIFDRPQWVHRLMGLCSDYTVRLVQRLASTGLHSLMIAESSAGVGISPKMFREFIQPYDRRIADTCRQADILTSLHICGRSSALLESMADTGADAIEPLVPVACAGDTDLADAKRRVGHRVSLMGGFNPQVLTEGTADDVRIETSKCLEAAARGGGYILRTAGQIFEARPESLRAFVETGRELGRYGSPLL
jgi:uroporphyrinogen decarboxylase